MMNKKNKAQILLQDETISLLIVILVVTMFLIGIYSLINFIKHNDAKDAAKSLLDEIEAKIKAVESNDVPATISFQGIRGWMLIGWSKGEEGRPNNQACYFSSCLCICPFDKGSLITKKERAKTCQTQGVCKPFKEKTVLLSVSPDASATPEQYLTDKGEDSLDYNSRLVKLKSKLMELEITKNPNRLKIYENLPSDEPKTLLDTIMAMCFLSREQPELDKEDVAGEAVGGAVTVGTYKASEGAVKDVQLALSSGQEAVIMEGTQVRGLDSYLDSIQFRESKFEVDLIKKNGAVIKHFPEKNIYNLVVADIAPPTGKFKVIGQVGYQGQIMQVNDKMVSSLGKDIEGVIGLTGSHRLPSTSLLDDAAKIATKEAPTVEIAKLGDVKLAASKRILKIIPKNSLFFKASTKLAGKALFIWGATCDLTTIGLTVDEYFNMMSAMDSARDSAATADEQFTKTVPERTMARINALQLYEQQIENTYLNKLANTPNLKESLTAYTSFLEEAKAETNYLQERANRFFSNKQETTLPEVGIEKITPEEQNILMTHQRLISKQITAAEKGLKAIESKLQTEPLQDSPTIDSPVFEHIKQTSYSLGEDYTNYAEKRINSPETILWENHISYNNAHTRFYFNTDLYDQKRIVLYLDIYEIGEVKDNTIIINKELYQQALSQISEKSKTEAEKHYTALQGAKIEYLEIFPQNPAAEGA